MLVSNSNNRNQYTPQFSALHIADAGRLKLYKLTDVTDKNYLKMLEKKVDISELMPNLSKTEAARWHEMLEYAVRNAQDPKAVTYLEAIDGKPCGILTYVPSKNNYFDLRCICTWPVEVGKKVSLAGKTLFYQIFKDCLDFKRKEIFLHAITDGPVDTVRKYSQLGFKQTSNVFPTKVEMEIKDFSIRKIMQSLSDVICYRQADGERVHLINELG